MLSSGGMGVVGDEGVVVMEEDEGERASTREHEGTHDGDGWRWRANEWGEARTG
jgi:hypothetical protein